MLISFNKSHRVTKILLTFLIPCNSINLTFGRLELDDVSCQVGVTVVGRLPAQFHRATSLVDNLETMRRFRFLLDEKVDARVITAKRVGCDAGEERRVLSVSFMKLSCYLINE